eukprot:TRINITY_DN1367_c0_g1_i1.p1 TRINITY_DN1367_c0_g1~~TRINITY_DN1367_c0_g1_i1.p1  ORF type:complete len:206 (+),score=46.21 TRINITY_DN1367_c0_g1_i1:31-648(+)
MSDGKKALILIDLQNDFMPGGSLAVNEGELCVPVANRFMEDPQYDIIVSTQDFHPADHQSFAVMHPGKQPYDVIDLHGLEQVLWPVHCVQGTEGTQFHSDLNTEKFDKVFPKGTDPTVDSYSGFYDNGKKHSTGMGEWLQAQGVTHVDCLGVASDFCVRYTVIDAAGLGFVTRVFAEGCRAVNPENEQAAFQAMQDAGATVIPRS